jgi:hypothetical protein
MNLTPGQIDALEAGRKLDVLVAEHVMGWKQGRRYGNGNGEWIFPEGPAPHFRNDWEGTPRYSTDIAAAFTILERWFKAGLGAGVDMDGHSGIWCTISTSDGVKHHAFGDTVPHAICLAALKAVAAR